MKDSALIC